MLAALDAAAEQLDQRFPIARDLNRFLDRAAVFDEALHRIAGREVYALGQFLDVELDQVLHAGVLAGALMMPFTG